MGVLPWRCCYSSSSFLYVVLLVLQLLFLLARVADASSLFIQGSLGRVESYGSLVAGVDGTTTNDLDESLVVAATKTLQGILVSYDAANNGGSFVTKAEGDDTSSVPDVRPVVELGLNQDKEGNHHMRFLQYIEELPVQGSALVMHVKGNGDGTVYALNGEYTSPGAIVNQVNLPCEEAMEIALSQSGIQGDTTWITECLDAAVLGRDGKSYKGFERRLLYNGYKQAVLFASGEDGKLVALHPKTYMARRLETWDCNGVGDPTKNECPLVSNHSKPIHTGQYGVDDAHNYAIKTYNFYYQQYGRDSLNNKGVTLVSYANVPALSFNPCPNAQFLFIPQYQVGFMLYCSEDSEYYAFSKGADVVAHELTHGVTDYTSQLIYQNESGAMNEAMSDVFGASVERIMLGKSIRDTWLIGESLYKNGVGYFRDMSDPAADGKSSDYYPDRRLATCTCEDDDHGWVHSNSGIMNLAFVLMTQGGKHPRGKTNFKVTPIDKNFDISIQQAAAIFYDAQTKCLTPSAEFLSIRKCMQILAGEYKRSVAEAWAAVGVGDRPPKRKKPVKNMMMMKKRVNCPPMSLLFKQPKGCKKKRKMMMSK